MRQGKMSVLLLFVFLLSGCSAISGDFSCGQVAGDRCLTIEQVDAMTNHSVVDKWGRPIQLVKTSKKQTSGQAKKNTYHQRIWFPSQKKGQGNKRVVTATYHKHVVGKGRAQ